MRLCDDVEALQAMRNERYDDELMTGMIKIEKYIRLTSNRAVGCD